MLVARLHLGREQLAQLRGQCHSSGMSSPNPSSSTREPGTRIGVYGMAFGGLATLAAAMGIGRFVYTPLLPDLMSGLDLTPGEAGFIASSNYVGYLAGAVLAGYNWAAGKERITFYLSLLATIILLALMPLAVSVETLSMVRFASGVASAFAMVFCTTIIFTHLEAAGRTDLQAMHFAGVGVGIGVSALLLIALDATAAVWQTGWIAAAVLALFAAVAGVSLVRVDPLRGEQLKEPPLQWTRPMVSLTVAYGLFGLGYIVTATFLIAIVRDQQAHSSVEGAVWLVAGVMAAVSVYLWNPLARRIGLLSAFILACLLEAVGVAASVILPAPTGPFVGAALLGGTFVVITAYGLQIGRTFAPGSGRRILAIMTASFGAGQIIGPLIAGTLADLSGSYTSGSLVAAVALLIAAALAFSSKPSRT